MGRRADDVSPAQLDADIDALGAALGENFNYPTRWDKSANPASTPLRKYVLGDVEPAVLLLFGAVILVLVMACANAAALILARTTDRTAELSVRSALGAGSGRITRQILTESVVLALVSGALGAVLARAMFGTLLASLPLTGGYDNALTFPWAGFVAAFGLAVAVAVAVASVPIFRLHRGDLGALRGSRSDSGLQRNTGKAHGFLVGIEVVVALTLVSGATLLIRSVSEMRQLDLGVDPDGVTTVDLVTTSDLTQTERTEFFDQLLERVQALPGVELAGYINRLPIRDGGWQGGVGVESRPELTGVDSQNSYWRVATPDYFEAAGIELKAGRLFDERDRSDGVPVALVSESFANLMWPDQDPIGQRIAGMRAQQGEWQEVVGVVEETRVFGIRGDNDIVMYRPYGQTQMLGTAQVLVMKTSADVIPAVRAFANDLNPRVATYRAGAMTTVVNSAMSEPLQLRFFLMLFACLGLVLGAVGVYGVVSYSVNRRRAEFGVRMAMGATASDVLRYVLGRGMVPVLAGVVVGIGLSVAGARAVAGFLYGIAPTDPASLVSAAAVLLGTGILAAIIPAWRAGRTSPVEVLRVD